MPDAWVKEWRRKRRSERKRYHQSYDPFIEDLTMLAVKLGVCTCLTPFPEPIVLDYEQKELEK
jgi:hypothetical protein